MPTKQGDLLNTQSNAEETPNNNSTLVDRIPIENTPFKIIKHEDKYFIGFGKYRLTEDFNTADDAEDQLYINLWNIVLRMVIAMIHIDKEKPIDEYIHNENLSTKNNPE